MTRLRDAGAHARTLLGALVLAGALLVIVGPLAVLGADAPSPPPAGDPRSVGEGPGLVGNPLFAIAIVAAIGVGSAVLTALYVRATGGARRNRSR